MRCTIRTASLQDVADLARIKIEASSSPPYALEAFSEAESRYAAFVSASPRPVLLAHADGVCAGFAAMKPDAHAAAPARNPLQLWQLYLLPRFHGSGIAAQLMAAVFSQAHEQHHDVIWLGVSESNARAIAFYRRHAFTSAGIHAVGADHHAHRDLIMARAVDAP